MVPTIKASQPWSSTAAPTHNRTTLFDSWYDVLFMKLCYFLKWIIKMFFAKREMSLCLFFRQEYFSSMYAVFFPSLFLITDSQTLNEGKWGLQFIKCLCVLFCFLTSWMSCRWRKSLAWCFCLLKSLSLLHFLRQILFKRFLDSGLAAIKPGCG